ncbi:hypothetical protein GOV07_02275 [Candidatus Woesearchaeota archaeon]|nr:hypothetical protein [Candidatus Woesearchaeota archaeon]
MTTTNMKQFIPDRFNSGILGNTYPAEIEEEHDCYRVRYWRDVSNQTKKIVGKRKLEDTIPKNVNLDKRAYEALGLLQGEMSKTNRGPITFCNSRPELINLVLVWFLEEMKIPLDNWHWYIKLNIQEPQNPDLKKVLTEELTEFWMRKSPIHYELRFPKTLSFIKNTQNEAPKNNGTLIIERRAPIFVQTLQKFVKDMTFSMPERSREEIIAYLRGIIAAEACVNYKLSSGHRRVFITATNEDERAIFTRCLNKLGVETKDCKPIKDIVISRIENIHRLHELDLMSLNEEKHERFLQMLSSYRGRWPESA